MKDADLLQEAEAQLSAMRLDEALKLFDQAEGQRFDPDSCAGGRWVCHMLKGDFESAWKESDAIAARGKPDVHRFWTGEALAGKSVLIRCLHGLGDTLQFIRYAPLLRREARRVTVEAQPGLKALLEGSELADEVITWTDGEPAWDAQVEVIELPRIFRTSLASIPQRVPYLRPPTLQSPLPATGSATPRAGIVWAGSAYNPARSLGAQDVCRILDTPGWEFYSLQAGEERLDLDRRGVRIPSLFLGEGELARTASVVTQLDLVITVDTMMAHLAGALARPVWTLLPFQCDWRWMLARDDSPWYPSMRLFRQPEAGNWGPVIERVRSELLLATQTCDSCSGPRDNPRRAERR